MNDIPDELRLALLKAGYHRIDVGSLMFSLRSGKGYRRISLDGEMVGKVEAPIGACDWQAVGRQLRENGIIP